MDKSIADICEELDALSLRSLELMEEKIAASVQLEKMVREGNIELAKARYIRGKESIGSLQIPQDGQMSSLFDLRTSMTKKRGKNLATFFFDISFKTSKDNEKPQDPIRWFGVLVPQNLRTAQKRFQDSVYLAVRVANINSELESLPAEIENLKSLKIALNE